MSDRALGASHVGATAKLKPRNRQEFESMANIPAMAVKSLRQRTGAGMMECKKALVETGGDEERAIDLLRQKGAAKAARRVGRETTEGAVMAAQSAGQGPAALAELSCETDFVARNESFLGFAERVAEAVRDSGFVAGEESGEEFLDHPNSEALKRELVQLKAAVGENLHLRRVARFVPSERGVVGSYVHFGNRIGVLVELDGVEPSDSTRELARELALHVAATNPLGVSPEDIPAEDRERERSVLVKQARAEGKPAEIVEKIVEGRMRKYFAQNTLLMQGFVKDPETRIEGLIEERAPGGSVRRFTRIEIGV